MTTGTVQSKYGKQSLFLLFLRLRITLLSIVKEIFTDPIKTMFKAGGFK